LSFQISAINKPTGVNNYSPYIPADCTYLRPDYIDNTPNKNLTGIGKVCNKNRYWFCRKEIEKLKTTKYNLAG
jgi:hypothetical protein